MIKLTTLTFAAIALLFSVSLHAQEFDGQAGPMIIWPEEFGGSTEEPSIPDGWNAEPLAQDGFINPIVLKVLLDTIGYSTKSCMYGNKGIFSEGSLNDQGQVCVCDDDGCQWVSNP